MNYVLALALGFCGSHALADTQPEVFTLSALTSISKCTNGNCDYSGQIMSGIAITLDACTGVTRDSYSYSCSGQWTDTESRDGFSFSSSVTVTKTVTTPPGVKAIDAQVTYQIVASTGPTASLQQANAVTLTLGQPGVMTDTVSVTGEAVNVTNAGLSYVPTLTLGPLAISPVTHN